MNNMRIVVLGCLSLCGVLLLFFVDKYNAVPENPKSQAQKFRYGELCSDGLRVEYVSTIRLPKSVVCQPPVGE